MESALTGAGVEAIRREFGPLERRKLSAVLTGTTMHFCLRCGTQLVGRLIEGRELEACPACDFVLWRNPVVATMVIVEETAGVVLGKRSIEPGRGLWCLPGGFVNDDEHPEAAAARECLEEIGARVEIEGLLGVYHIVRGDGTGMLGLAYRGRLAPGEKAIAGSEMLEVGVFDPATPPRLAFPSHRQALADWLAKKSDDSSRALR